MPKVIDWEKHGQFVRFALGADDDTEYWGDDWDDRPYEHNAGCVYDKYIIGFHDTWFSDTYDVYEPAEDPSYGGNSPFSKEDFKNREAPFLVLVPKGAASCYSEAVLHPDAQKAYFGDKEWPTFPGEMELLI